MSGPLHPVSSAFLVPDGAEFEVVQTGLRYIDSKHVDGLLPRIAIRRGPRSARGALGYFDVASMQLYVFDECEDGALARTVLYHEVGHVLDIFGLPGTGWFSSSSGNPLMERWSDAVYRSNAVLKLATSINELGQTQNLNRQLIESVELWARSYTQYIATRSGDTGASDVLREHTIRLAGGTVVRSHWDAVDFLPVHAAIDDLFRSAGWAL